MEPTSAHDVRRSFRLLPVAFHDAVSAGHDFANGLAIARHILIFGIDHAQLRSRYCISGACMRDVALLSLAFHSGFNAGSGEGRRSLREAITAVAQAAKLFFHLAHQRRRRGSSTQADSFQSAQVILVQVGRIDQRSRHGGHQGATMHAFPLDEPKNIGRIELLHHHVLAARQRE